MIFALGMTFASCSNKEFDDDACDVNGVKLLNIASEVVTVSDTQNDMRLSMLLRQGSEAKVERYGFCYTEDPDLMPDMYNAYTIVGNYTNFNEYKPERTVTSTIQDVIIGTTFYVRGYVILESTGKPVYSDLYTIEVGTPSDDPEDGLKAITEADLNNAYATKSISRIMNLCHDPSIVIDNISNSSNPTYYIYGSHLGHGYTTAADNYKSWTTFASYEENENVAKSMFANASNTRISYAKAYDSNAVTKVKNSKGEEVAFTGFNMHNWQYTGGTIKGNQWAPDVIYNKKMKKWCMYMSINSDKWCSGIVLLTSDNIKGPWVYQGPVVFSGFTGSFAHVGYGAADDWKKTDYTIATGETSLAARYKSLGDNWSKYWPNAIDPCVLYDDNDDLWMSYGSWFGGIFMLRLDNETGLRDYTHKYEYQENGTTKAPGAASQNCTSDPYFGIKIAGGYGVSGEASYIQKIGKNYYLWITNGGLDTKGGYQMRVYRSSSITGPYTDTWGLNAMPGKAVVNYGSNANRDYGVKLFGNYKWEFMPFSEIAQGHNSVTIDHLGRTLLFNHTRFKEIGHEGHEVRVHQLFMTQDGWPVSAPFEFDGETVTDNDIATKALYSAEQICGEYQLMLHPFRQNTAAMDASTPVNISLLADGTITGDYTGTWSCPENTSYIDIKLNNVLGSNITATFHGVLTEQTIDYTNIKSLCFTCCGTQKSETSQASNGQALTTSGLCIWGSKADYKAAIKYTLENLTIPVKPGEKIKSSVTLPTSGKLGAKVYWTTSNADILTATGEVKGKGKVVLTLNIEKDGYVLRKTYSLNVEPAA